MSNRSRVKKIAHLLLDHSLDEDQRVNEDKVKEILSSLREDPPLQHREILRFFARLVKIHMSSYQGIIEYAGGKGSQIVGKIQASDSFKNSKMELKSSENPELIAGFKLKIGDDVYEDSILNRLNRLRKIIA